MRSPTRLGAWVPGMTHSGKAAQEASSRSTGAKLRANGVVVPMAGYFVFQFCPGVLRRMPPKVVPSSE